MRVVYEALATRFGCSPMFASFDQEERRWEFRGEEGASWLDLVELAFAFTIISSSLGEEQSLESLTKEEVEGHKRALEMVTWEEA